ncbi:transcriptional initiation protein Tat [Grimontia hollisae]|uniref:Formate dehydrogenase subunit or accessory protein n=2 Tax=Grimontia hollisae TaxID=673 RepID=D0IBM8_GRIHO|nr:twin-arginine translocation signal domain-containing protein [Grimontia hollisae]AMG29679.1 transcriptional initiation protein Tat [Grimontia hollisae]EEY71296.1 hypothetical protein VHA_003155 [Grimontia hollisae CIP 101886]MDF2184252.1 twin-arginine translocation signal domain-containing protein [Grimontia hollisae]STO43617.1 formate dehydrogenase region TAT target [Grimontia hollisae]STO57027.1 formate dehydrogenase region TAT target [Grimontia hollisae]
MSENQKETGTPNEARRQFLKGLGVAAAVGAATTAVSVTAQAEVTVKTPEPKRQSGYRETQHIRDYYDSL